MNKQCIRCAEFWAGLGDRQKRDVSKVPEPERKGVAEVNTEISSEKAKEVGEMTLEEQIAFVVDFLETSYTGARAMDDVEMMVRLERAIAVMKTPAEVEVFLPEFEEEYIDNEVREVLGFDD